MNNSNTSKARNCSHKFDTETLVAAKEIITVVIKFLASNLKNSITAKKIVAIILLALRVHVPQVMELTGLGRTTIYKIYAKVKSGLTLEELNALLIGKGGRGRPSKLSDSQKEEIIAHIDEHNFFSLWHIADYIFETHGISMALSSVRNFLQESGIKKYKCGSLPAKADPKVQREFHENTMVDLIEKNKRREIKLYYMDAAHFVLGNGFIASIYGRTRRFCKSFSGRKRYNVLGAVEFASKRILTVTNNTYITAPEVVEMLCKIHAESDGLVPYVFLDNARYQKCTLVSDTAKKLGIRLVYLPSYSPNLNLIERLWKYTKAELRCHYYSDFDTFKKQIDKILNEAQTTRKDKLESLLSDKFQFFDDFEDVDTNTYEVKKKQAG